MGCPLWNQFNMRSQKKLTSNPFLSVVIPVYNEQSRLDKLNHVISFLKQQKFSSELIIVNDGSTDATLQKLSKYKSTFPLKIISYTKNRGKGFAIKTGMLASSGNYCLFTDIDLSTPLTELKKFLPFIEKFDVVIGSRKMSGAQLLKRQSNIRENMGKCFTYLSQKLLGLSVSDFTCGFKCFSKKSVNLIFPHARIERWGFDSEVLFIAQKRRLRVKEIAVEWENDFRTKVKFPQDIINSFTELVSIIINNIAGKYQ